MSRDKPPSKQSGPTTLYGRQVAYDREIFISICARLLRGEDLKTICAKPPMPIPQKCAPSPRERGETKIAPTVLRPAMTKA